MHLNRSYLPILLTFLAMFSFSAAAQPEMKAIFFSAPADAPKKMYAHVGEDIHEIRLFTKNFSSALKLPKGAYTIRFSEKKTLPEDYPADQTVNLRISEGTKRFLLFVYPNPAQANLPIALQKVDTDLSFKKGEMLWINTTTSLIGGKVGSQTLVIKPGESKVIKAPVAKGQTFYDVLLDHQPKGKKQSNFVDARWPYNPNARLIGIVSNFKGGRAPIVDMISDIEKEPEAP